MHTEIPTRLGIGTHSTDEMPPIGRWVVLSNSPKDSAENLVPDEEN